jgi:hypothetical protein
MTPEEINQRHEALWATGPSGVLVLTDGGVQALEKAQAVSDELERVIIDRDRLREILRVIAGGHVPPSFLIEPIETFHSRIWEWSQKTAREGLVPSAGEPHGSG